MRIVWEEVSPEELQTDIESIRAASAEAPDDVLESTVEWVLDNCDDDSKRARVLVCSVDGVNGGYAAFLEHPTAFRYSFGEGDIFKYKIRDWRKWSVGNILHCFVVREPPGDAV